MVLITFGGINFQGILILHISMVSYGMINMYKRNSFQISTSMFLFGIRSTVQI